MKRMLFILLITFGLKNSRLSFIFLVIIVFFVFFELDKELFIDLFLYSLFNFLTNILLLLL
jgi:hypothetical protein